MARLALRLAAFTAFGAFGAIGATLALIGLGVPFLAASLLVAIAAGVAAWGILQAIIVRPLASLSPETPALLIPRLLRERERLATLERLTTSLRHDVRGMLSPAMLVADRLVSHADPKVARSGETVVQAITRTTERLAATRGQF